MGLDRTHRLQDHTKGQSTYYIGDLGHLKNISGDLPGDGRKNVEMKENRHRIGFN